MGSAETVAVLRIGVVLVQHFPEKAVGEKGSKKNKEENHGTHKSCKFDQVIDDLGVVFTYGRCASDKEEGRHKRQHADWVGTVRVPSEEKVNAKNDCKNERACYDGIGVRNTALKKKLVGID